MKPRQQRMVFIGVVLAGVAVAAALALKAFQGNLLYFYSPSQVLAGEAPTARNIRLGGMVVDGSIVRPDDDVTVRFDVSDSVKQITVEFSGLLPDLFREGQGIVAIGKLTDGNVLIAEEVLAKHDENYMPPDVAEAMAQARSGGSMPTASP